MPGEDSEPRSSRRHRSRSRSNSRERHRHRSHRDSYDKRKRYDERDDERPRKRHRSRSRDRPSKRRSISPDVDTSGISGKTQLRDSGRAIVRNNVDFDFDDRRRISRRRHGNHSNSRSPPSRSRRKPSASPGPFKRSKAPLPSQQEAFTGGDGAVVKADEAVPEKQKPNFGTTGRLAAASNTVQATGGQKIVLKYHEPSEARKPSARDAWRMYVFKGDEIVDTVELWEQSCWLFGREAAVVDFLIEHPSCSKQHAVLQFRYIEKRNEFGDKLGRVRPYVIDLESANGTMVNEEKVPEGRYVELRDKDVVKFGHSSREYVLQLPKAN